MHLLMNSLMFISEGGTDVRPRGVHLVCKRDSEVEEKRGNGRHIVSTEVGCSSRYVVYWRSDRSMEEGGRSMQTICTVCLDEIVGCVGNTGIVEERSKNVTNLLNMSRKPPVEVRVDTLEEALLDKGCATSFRSVHRSVTRGKFVSS